jgi:glycosyltransferase involved in cell wall biosynthesis
MGQLSTAVAGRFALLGREFSVNELERASPHTWRLCLRNFVSDSSHTAEFRAGIAYLGFNAVYPLRHQFQQILNLIELGQIDDVLHRLDAGACDRQTRLSPIVVPRGPLVDITRYSGARSISGITRVVRDLILSPTGRDLNGVVWAAGRIGLVDVDGESGNVAYPAGQWRRGNQRARLGHNIIQTLRSVTMKSPITAFVVFSFARWIPLPAVVLNSRHPEPRHTVLLGRSTLVIAEVMSREVADRLTTWQRVGTELKTRMVVHDFLPLSHSEYFSASSTHEHLLNIRAAANSERVFLATPLLKKELVQHCSTIGKHVPPVEVLPLPMSVPSSVRRAGPNENSPYVVFMGGFEERKRLLEFVDYTLAYRNSSDQFRVIIVGKPPLVTNRNQLAMAQRIVRNRHIFSLVSGISDDQLAELICGALATIYVSGAEGYGLPITESLATGTPVIASRTDVNAHLNKLYGGVLMTFDMTPATMEEIRKLHNPAYRNSVVNSIRSSKIPRNVTRWSERVTRGIEPG